MYEYLNRYMKCAIDTIVYYYLLMYFLKYINKVLYNLNNSNYIICNLILSLNIGIFILHNNSNLPSKY